VLFNQYDLAFEVGAVLLAVVTAGYIMIGGMRSVAWTDALQCVLLCSGMLLAGLAIVISFGSWGAFSGAICQLPKSSLTVPGNTGFWKLPMLFTVCLLMPLGGILQPAQWMRFYSARDAETLRRSALVFVIVLTGCFLLGIMLVGLGGQVLYPLEESADGKVLPNPIVGSYDQVLIVVIKEKLPLLLGPTLGVVLASAMIVAIMAAAMSTADSSLHAIGALLTRDVYDRFVRPQAGERERVWVGRLAILATTFVCLVFVLRGTIAGSSLAGFMEMIVGLALFAVAFAVQLLPITVDILFIRRGTTAGATAGLIAGLIAAFSFTTLPGVIVAAIYPENITATSAEAQPLLVRILDGVSYVKSILPIHASAWGLGANVMVFGLVSLVTSPVPAGRRGAFAQALET
jgi:SSS family solute:Na+ symporter